MKPFGNLKDFFAVILLVGFIKQAIPVIIAGSHVSSDRLC